MGLGLITVRIDLPDRRALLQDPGKAGLQDPRDLLYGGAVRRAHDELAGGVDLQSDGLAAAAE